MIFGGYGGMRGYATGSVHLKSGDFREKKLGSHRFSELGGWE